jgi:DUF1707 SHOCT-like domain/Cell wall-active antibiotics response LiaF, C-terminal
LSVTDPPAGSDPKGLRASDSDRDRIAEVLRDAAGEGRLGMDELDDRLSAVYAAKTYGELEPIVQDLPNARSANAPAAEPARYQFGGTPSSASAIAIMGGFSRKGEWVVPATFTALTIMGGGEIDLREARFAEHVTTIHATAIMGGIAIIVPEDADVRVNGIGLMGAFEHGATGVGKPGAPTIHINGLAFWGAVEVKRKRPKNKPKREQLDSKKT